MDAGSRAAPDLFAALEWSARVAPLDATPALAADPASARTEVPAPESLDEFEVDATPSDLAATPSDLAATPPLAAPTPAPPTPPPPSPPRAAATPPSLPSPTRSRATPVAPPPAATPMSPAAKAPIPPPPPSLADLLEPEAPAKDASPALDEFEGLLDLFDGDPAAAPVARAVPPSVPAAAVPPAAPTPAPPTSAPPAPVAKAPAAPTPVAPRSPRRPTPVIASMPKPGALSTTASTVDFPAPGDPAVSAQLVAAEIDASSPLVSRVAPVVPLPSRVDAPVLEPESAPRRSSAPVLWIALTLLLGGALAWVVATQTDLLKGDVIAQRDAEAQAADVADLEARKAEQERAKVEYGTIEIASTPKGARVFELHDGPAARFEQLPVDHEYMVLVMAPGFAPRVRVVKGTELAGPVVMDLDAVAPGTAVPTIPEHDPPKLSRAPSKQVATLELRSNTAGATLGLLVGYTPGVKIVDVDVEVPHRYLLVLAEHEPTEVVVKGRHFEETNGTLEALTEVTLGPAKPPVVMPAAPAGADADAAAVEGAAVVEGAGEDDEAVVVDADTEAAPAPSKPSPAKKSKKKKRRSKRRR